VLTHTQKKRRKRKDNIQHIKRIILSKGICKEVTFDRIRESKKNKIHIMGFVAVRIFFLLSKAHMGFTPTL
jgi:hypothetical protein